MQDIVLKILKYFLLHSTIWSIIINGSMDQCRNAGMQECRNEIANSEFMAIPWQFHGN